jgi:predicted transglutaminase-like cysteine proteinase
MKLRYLFILLILAGCASNELPTAGTMTTGDEVNAPKQWNEFCERDVHNICPEEEDDGTDLND